MSNPFRRKSRLQSEIQWLRQQVSDLTDRCMTMAGTLAEYKALRSAYSSTSDVPTAPKPRIRVLSDPYGSGLVTDEVPADIGASFD